MNILNSLQAKLLAAILAILIMIAGLMIRGGRHIEVTAEDQAFGQALEKKVQPSPHRYLVP